MVAVKTAQEVPRPHPDGPKRPPNPPKSTLRGSKIPQKSPKRTPRPPKELPKRLQGPPGGSKKASRDHKRPKDALTFPSVI